MKVKKQIVSTIIIVVASISISAVGAYAFFNANKSILTNKFSAGTLDLDVKATDNINQPISIDNVGSEGKILGSRSWKIKNTGTLSGKLIFNLQNINNLENGCNGPELDTEPNCEADNVGELGKAIIIKAVINNETVAQSTLENGKNFVYDKALILEPGQETELSIEWNESDAGYGNEVQSDTVNFDMVFRLEQQQ